MAQDDVACRRSGTVHALVMLQQILGPIINSSSVIVNVAIAAFETESKSSCFDLAVVTVSESCFWFVMMCLAPLGTALPVLICIRCIPCYKYRGLIGVRQRRWIGRFWLSYSAPPETRRGPPCIALRCCSFFGGPGLFASSLQFLAQPFKASSDVGGWITGIVGRSGGREIIIARLSSSTVRQSGPCDMTTLDSILVHHLL